MTERSTLAFAMYEGWEPSPFADEHRARLEAIVEVLDWEPLGRFDGQRAHDVLSQADILLGHWGCPVLDEAALARAPRLRLFAYAAGTVKLIVTPAVFDRGVVVSSGAVANGIPVAYYTLAAILFAAKNVFFTRELHRTGDLLDREPPIRLREPGVHGKRVGIVGASAIGRMVIDLLRPIGFEIVVYDPYLGATDSQALGVTAAGLDELCATSDIVSLHAPVLPETMGMIGRAQLGLMRDGAMLINTARGYLVDHEALEAELVSGRLHAVLDVTDPHEPLPSDSPLFELPNVFLTPHIAGAHASTDMFLLADHAIDEIERFVVGEPLTHEVRREDLDRIA